MLAANAATEAARRPAHFTDLYELNMMQAAPGAAYLVRFGNAIRLTTEVDWRVPT